MVTEQQYLLCPNPNVGDFMLQQTIADDGLVSASISDLTGRTVFHRDLQFTNTKTTLNIDDCPAGVYLLELTDSKQHVFRLKFVVE